MSLLARNVGVTVGGREVLRAISMEAQRGELLAVIGPNGAGKTTFLKAIACLLGYSGSLQWDGKELAGMRSGARARQIAYLPQGHIAHWPISVRDVVLLGRAPFASSLTRLASEDEHAIEQALAAVDALYLADRPVTALSGGERARVMLARALAVGAPLLLADEPVAALDPAHQLQVMEILSAQAKAGRLVIAVSHDLLLAARYADRIMVLRDGELAAVGAARDVLTGTLLREVFDVETRRIQGENGTVLEIPWRPARRDFAHGTASPQGGTE